ncbi:MAG: TIM barrel protein, partial [Solirubrobacterales bacterium]
ERVTAYAVPAETIGTQAFEGVIGMDFEVVNPIVVVRLGVFDDLHDPVQLERVLAVSARACRAIAAAGGSVLVIIDSPSPKRVASAGRAEAAPRLDAAGWGRLVEAIARISEIARGAGLRPAVHPHAGGYIEFEDEIERLVEETDFDLCLDTGHLAYAGTDPARALRAYGSRLAHMHLKDVDREVLGEVRSRGLDFWQAIEREIFCPLGEGVVDLDAVGAAVEEIGYDGFATIEQDRVPGTGSPLRDLEASVAVMDAVTGVRR